MLYRILFSVEPQHESAIGIKCILYLVWWKFYQYFILREEKRKRRNKINGKNLCSTVRCCIVHCTLQCTESLYTAAQIIACILDLPHVSSLTLKNYLLFLWFNWFASKIDIIVGFPGGSVVKNLPANARDASNEGSIPESGRSPRVGNGNPLQYSCL